MAVCITEGCDRRAHSRGMCRRCWQRWRRRTPDLNAGPPRKRLPSTPENFWLRTKPEGACVVWTGWRDKHGYGRVPWDRPARLAHRVAFLLRMGRWPDGILRHLCDNPPCVLHVVEGTMAENSRDRIERTWCPVTHCVHGHLYDEENTIIDSGGRRCRACRKEYHRTSAERRRAQKNEAA